MILLLGITFHLSTHATYAQTITPDESANFCETLGHCRGLSDIVWSCLAMIFSCTWLALHLNVPKQGKGILWNLGRHAVAFTVALIAPEVILEIAWCQLIVAKNIAAQHKNHKWTTTHGFFANMGGFMVHSGNGDYFLRPEYLCTYLNNGRISITEEQIQDKSKGDSFTKGFVVLQTTWFIVQTSARVIARLPITELEYSTLAFTVLNGITYALWWNKPLDVQCPIIITEISGVVEKREDGILDKSSIEGDTACLPVIDKDPEKGGNEESDSSLQTSDLFSLAQGLYTDPDGISTCTVGYTLAIGVLFGGIHCLAWLSHFPTAAEELIWRIASAITAVVPAMLFIVWLLSDNTNTSFAVALGILLIPYIIARLLLLLLIFTTLRSLPPNAYVTVQWTTLIPHV